MWESELYKDERKTFVIKGDNNRFILQNLKEEEKKDMCKKYKTIFKYVKNGRN